MWLRPDRPATCVVVVFTSYGMTSAANSDESCPAGAIRSRLRPSISYSKARAWPVSVLSSRHDCPFRTRRASNTPSSDANMPSTSSVATPCDRSSDPKFSPRSMRPGTISVSDGRSMLGRAAAGGSFSICRHAAQRISTTKVQETRVDSTGASLQLVDRRAKRSSPRSRLRTSQARRLSELTYWNVTRICFLNRTGLPSSCAG